MIKPLKEKLILKEEDEQDIVVDDFSILNYPQDFDHDGKVYYATNKFTNRDIINKIRTQCKEIIIQPGTTALHDMLFLNFKALTKISIPDSVISVGYACFRGCESLQEVQLPKTLKLIEPELFYDCHSLQSVNIPAGVKKIGYSAFSDCTNLASINLPNGIRTIEDEAFYGCKALKSIFIPKSIREIQDYVFSNCSADLVIYCELQAEPPATVWYKSWNVLDGDKKRVKVVWGAKPQVAEDLHEDEEVEVIPAVELEQEPLSVNDPALIQPEPEPTFPPEPVIPEEVKTNSFVSMINSLVSAEWQAIDQLNSIVATFMVDNPEATDAIEVLKQIGDEKTAHVGMLQKALGLVDGKTSDLVKSGEDKVDEIVSGDETEESEEELEEIEVGGEVTERMSKNNPHRLILEHLKRRMIERMLNEDGEKLEVDFRTARDAYWSYMILDQMDYMIERIEDYNYPEEDEDVEILSKLSNAEKKKLALDLVYEIMNDDYVLEVVDDSLEHVIRRGVRNFVADPANLTAAITPAEGAEEVEVDIDEIPEEETHEN